MKRIAVTVAAVCLVGALGINGTVSATPARAAGHITVGSSWTVLGLPANGCTNVTFEAGHVFNDYGAGMAGTYTGGRTKVSMKWTVGSYGSMSLAFSGTWSRSMQQYNGTVSYTGGSEAGQLVPTIVC